MTAKRFYLYPDSKKLQIILLFIFISFTLQAAKIQGYVFDEESGEPLIGANVMLEGTNVGTVSNSEGYYQLNSVVPGDYTIVASFIGYSEQRKDITVEKNQVLEINFQLQYGTIGIEEIQVTVQAKGQRKAINEQLGSTTISNFVSGDRIQEVPDANAAESVGRLPGISVKRSSGEGDQVVVRGLKPNLNLITINGVRMPSTNENNNAVGLSGISQYMLDGIEVRKSLTAQDDADVVGAIVDLKLATAQEGFHMNTVVESIYNGLTNNFGSYRASIQGSNRFFNNKLGAIANINLESVDRTRERYSAGFGRDTRVTTNEGVFLNNGSYQYHEIMRERFGTNIILDYKLPDGIIQFNTIYNSFVEDRWQRNLNYQVKPEASINKIQQSVETNNTSFVSSLNLETGLFDFAEFDLGASFTRGVRNDPVNQSLDFKYDARKDSPIDPEFLQNTYGKTGYDAIQHFRDRSEDYLVFGLWNNTKDFEQKERAIQSNLKIPFKLTKTISGFIKTGGKARFKSRDYDYEGDGKTGIYGADEKMRTAILQENPDYNWPFTAQERPALAEIPAYPLYDSWNRDILTDRVFLDEFASRGDVETVVCNLHEAGWADLDHWVVNANDAVDDYTGEERLYAGYVMTELRLEDKLVINAGIRYEDEETTYKGWGIKAIANEVNYPDTLEPSTRNNAFWLPSANVKFKYAEWADVRVAYSKSLAR
ncbi:MAG: TonB-dependent receptor domain-containing protein, partial [Bacteroidota bacterium]